MGKVLQSTLLPGRGFFITGKPSLFFILAAAFLFPTSYLATNLWGTRNLQQTAIFLVSNKNMFYLIIGSLLLWVLMWVISIWDTYFYVRKTTKAKQTGAAIIATLSTLTLLTVSVLGGYYSNVGIETLSSVLRKPTNNRAVKVTPKDNNRSGAVQSEPVNGLLSQTRTNILLIGSDSYPGRPGVRTDSMMLLSIHNATGNMTMIGIPRNLEGYQYRETNPMYNLYPEGKPNCGLECMINTVWEKGDERKDLYPGVENPGEENLKQVISDLTNLPIDRTAVINIRGFSALVDALGGVRINVPERLPIGGKIDPDTKQISGINGWIEPGDQTLNGYQAMWFTRSRVLSDDYSRMARQRCMIKALTSQMNPVTVLTKFPAIAKATKDNLTTDVSQEDLQQLAVIGARVQKGKTNSVVLNAKTISITHPDYDQIHAMIQKKLDEAENPAKPSPTSTSKKQSTPTAPTTPTTPQSNPTTDTAELYQHCAG